MIGRVFNGRYKIVERIGIGGMAEVYRAQDQVLGRIVAVKVMLPQYAADPEFTARFKQEAASAANLQSPYIVNVYDWGQDGDTYFIVMEFIRGTDLKTAVTQRGAINQRKVAEIGSQVCQALSVAHGQDIMHRDIKPQNIMVQPDGNVKVMDFGIARAKNSMKSQTSSVLGTAHYISPEQAQGMELTGATDMYSLGCVLYEAATGQLPFDGPDAVSVAMRQVNEEPVPPSQVNPSISPDLEAIIMKALQKNPANRFMTARDMKQALDDFMMGRPVNLDNFANAKTAVLGATLPPIDQPMGGQTAVMPVLNPETSGPMTTSNFRADNNFNMEDGKARKKKTVGIVLGLLAGIIAVVAIAFALMNSTGAADKVPNVIGQTEDAARSAIEAAGYEVGEVTQDYDATTVADRVCKTDPEAGTELEKGETVNLVISKGPKKGQVPSLDGMTSDQAEKAISDAGLVPQYAGNQASDADKDTVCMQDPEAGTELDEGSTVQYWISTGPEDVEVPDVLGWDQDSAIGALEDQGFAVDVQQGDYSNDFGEGEVMDQNPRGGRATKGSTVTIVISAGVDPATIPVSIPGIVGESEGGAIDTLGGAGFYNVSVEYQASSTVAEGKVISQSNSGKATTDTLITIVVSTGPTTQPADDGTNDADGGADNVDDGTGDAANATTTDDGADE